MSEPLTTFIQPSFFYFLQPPKRYTFEMPKIKNFVEVMSIGKTLNLFAGGVELSGIDEVRVDIDKTMPADFYMDAYDYVRECLSDTYDTIVFDPPYNLRKSREKYEGRYIGSLTKIKNEIPRILKTGGRMISFGYDSVGMSRSRGFTKTDIGLICHGGDHNDTIITVETLIHKEQ